jgi:hypothetical protein
MDNTSIHSYCANGSTECDGSCQPLLCAIQTAAGRATKFIMSFCTRKIYTSRHRVNEPTGPIEISPYPIATSDAYDNYLNIADPYGTLFHEQLLILPNPSVKGKLYQP